jgi:16S rRNA C967 or C1407 C5-methylase (RsmB/RsmF family)
MVKEQGGSFCTRWPIPRQGSPVLQRQWGHADAIFCKLECLLCVLVLYLEEQQNWRICDACSASGGGTNFIKKEI